MKQSLTCKFTQAHIPLPMGYYNFHKEIFEDLYEVTTAWDNTIFKAFLTGPFTSYETLGSTEARRSRRAQSAPFTGDKVAVVDWVAEAT